MTTSASRLRQLWRAYRLRWKRRYFLARAIRRRRQLQPVIDRTSQIGAADILVFCSVRNESARLPYFLDHNRRLGVKHFLMVDNDSSDGTLEFLRDQPDVSLWRSTYSYKAARFGIDWLTYLQFRHGHRHWCLTLDADEILVYPQWQDRSLPELTAWMDQRGYRAMGALMLDLYPKGQLDGPTYSPGQDPLEVVNWFDADNFTQTPRSELGSSIVRGGARARIFFADRPELAPTMNKVPLVKWNRRFAYLTSTHVILPAGLNMVSHDDRPSGALLHTKFLPGIVKRAAEEKYRAEHFSNSVLYDAYYDELATGRDLWCQQAVRFEGWQQLLGLGLIRGGAWFRSSRSDRAK